jgi:glycosyltransferase involved in cell wall biosynthesis
VLKIPPGKKQHRILRGLKQHARRWHNWFDLACTKSLSRFRDADIAFFHIFSPPPGGGAHQFMQALWGAFQQRGLCIENNFISATTRACLYNSFNFDFDRLRKLRHPGCRMVHRVDGPVEVYRGRKDGSDRRVWQMNQDLADATIFQSRYSLEKHLELGLVFRNPQVIMNTTNPHIFHATGRVPFDRSRKIRLISSSWSDNPNKGAPFYKQLEDYLDWSRFEYTFVGRSQVSFERIRAIPPVPSEQLAHLLRQHDIYLTASLHDPCSNSLIEALSCGLPALYIQSGGHPEIVGEAGLGFSSQEEVPDLLEQLIEEYESKQARISLPTLTETANRYLSVMGITR